MSDDLVKRICQTWIDDGCADDCFWEGWPECPTPEDILTPRMVFDRIEELEAKLAKAVEALEGVRAFVRHLALYADQGHTLVPALEKACTTLAELTGDKK